MADGADSGGIFIQGVHVPLSPIHKKVNSLIVFDIVLVSDKVHVSGRLLRNLNILSGFGIDDIHAIIIEENSNIVLQNIRRTCKGIDGMDAQNVQNKRVLFDGHIKVTVLRGKDLGDILSSNLNDICMDSSLVSILSEIKV